MIAVKRLFLQLILPCYHVGHFAEGTYNFTSLGTSQEEEPLQQIVDVEDEEEQGPDEDDDERKTSLDQRNDEEDLDDIREVTVAQNSGL